MSEQKTCADNRKGTAMKIGKISESVLNRSVLRLIKKHKNEVTKGAGIGEDCAFLSWKNSDMAVASTQTVTLPVRNAGYLAVMAAANNVLAAGAEPTAVTLALTLPVDAEEIVLKEIMKQAQNCCTELDIEIVGGHTEVSRAVNSPVICATVIGSLTEHPKREKLVKNREHQVDRYLAQTDRDVTQMDVVMSKWIGLEGTFILANEKEQELRSRYPVSLIRLAKDCGNDLSIRTEARIGAEFGVCAMHDMRNGGVFGALWELSRKLSVGLEIDLKKIPVRQETIEVCEFFDLNPYEFLSGGALLMVTENGEELAETLENEGIPAVVIGRTNGGNDKIIINQDETRYLEPAVPDEIFKILFI